MFLPASPNVPKTVLLANAQVLTTQTLTLGTAWFFSPLLNNELRFNYSKNEAESSFRLDTIGGAVVPSDSVLFPSPFTSADAAYTFSINSLQGTVWSIGRGRDNAQRQFNVVDNISLQRGSHSLKF